MPDPSDYLGRGLQNLPAPGGGSGGLPDVPANSGYWGLPGVSLSGLDALSLAPGGIFYAPFSVSSAIVVSAARFSTIEANGSPANVRIGIYGADGIGPDDQAPLWTSGSIAVAGDFIGNKDSTGLSVALAPGRYLAAIAVDDSIGFFGAKRSGFDFLGDDDQIKSLFFGIFTFGAFPTPGPDVLAATQDLVAPFLLQWHDA